MMSRRRRKRAAASRPVPVLVPEGDGRRPPFRQCLRPCLMDAYANLVRRSPRAVRNALPQSVGEILPGRLACHPPDSPFGFGEQFR